MKNEAGRDMIPVLIVFLLSLFGNGWNFMTMILGVPLVYYGLYVLNLIKPTEMYTPKPSKKEGFATEMYNYSHPILMPKAFYSILGTVYMIFGAILFLLFPIAQYFWNWASICWKMSSNSSRVEPINGRNSAVTDLDSRPLPPKSKKKKDDRPEEESPASFPRPDIPWSRASRQEKTARSLEKSVILQIEKNDQELRSIRQTFDQALDSIFGGSELTKVRFQDGMDKAVKMSAENLKAARDYVKVGHNPEVLQKFLSRSNLINKETGDLLDALVTHQQNQMEENLKGLSESLDELQDSLKYYH